MVAIGRGLMSRPRLLMLDEPSLGLAPMVFDTILDTIRRLNEGGLTILLVEQAVQDSLSVAHRCYVLGEGRVVLSGDPERVSRDPRVRDVYLGQAPALMEHGS
jgi:branched-chain amino acid transport system ATP-binding protein